MKQLIKRLKSKLRPYRFAFEDAQKYSKYSMPAVRIQGDFRYSILLNVHSLEKGMCMPNPRPFGSQKVEELMQELEAYPNQSDFEYEAGMSILEKWVEFYRMHNWEEALCTRVETFLQGKKFIRQPVGFEILQKPAKLPERFEDVIFSRHSVRSFSPEKIRQEDVSFAVECVRRSPSACNRQACRINQIESSAVKELLGRFVRGLSGFDLDTVQFFVITYDYSSISSELERNQGLFNAGLASMNFVNALTSRGIGSCFMQWVNEKEDDILLRKAMNLPDSEQIAVIVGAGYYPSKTIIACSARRSIEELLRII